MTNTMPSTISSTINSMLIFSYLASDPYESCIVKTIVFQVKKGRARTRCFFRQKQQGLDHSHMANLTMLIAGTQEPTLFERNFRIVLMTNI